MFITVERLKKLIITEASLLASALKARWCRVFHCRL